MTTSTSHASAEQVAHRRAQLLRVARLVVFALLAQSAVAALFASALARYPAAAVLIGLAEAAVRQVFPVKALPPRISPLPPPSTPPSS